MNLIVHIGTEKTGTTTIQQVLFKNRKALQAEGIHFLQCAGKKNNRALPAYCVNNPRDDFFRRHRLRTPEARAAFRHGLRVKLHAELGALGEEVHTVIMSSEQLSSRLLSVKEVRRFYALVAPQFSNIKILCWLREQCDMATSSYSTLLRSGGTQSFADHIKNCTPDELKYDYRALLDRWACVFGSDCLDVRVFSKRAFVDGDLICDFFARIAPGLINVIDRDVPNQNTSINAVGQRILLAVNRFLQKSRAVNRMGRRNAVRRRAVKMLESRFSGKGLTPSSADYRRIYESFYESNRQVRKKYVGGDDALFEFRPPC
jgi:hypothetical protein